jgi:excisionase family DNA binding protein
MSVSDHPRLLDTEEAAWYLNQTPRWVREKAVRRQIPAVKLGRAVRFRVEDLDAFIAGNVVPSR